ncbi:MAG TPA: alpha/beta fold hydrolase, partial [Ottowia sp.]|nr:alpha/beta fold hydrolase [Ottowia sp.]
MALLPTFTTLGHGPPVLLLHGSGGGFRSFAPQVETLASLGFRAIAWDMPGYGQSPPIEPYGFKGLAESCVALIEALAPLTGGAPVALLGQGLGGMVAQEVVLRRPDLVHQLVLVATAASVAPDDAYGRHAAQMLAWLEAGHDMARIAALRLPLLLGRDALPAGVQLATHCQARVHGATWRRALQALAGFERRAAL